MEKDESPILSTNVSMGIMAKNNNPSPISNTKPLILLIMGDFGYTSDTPERISSSQWNDFCTTHKFDLKCTIENELPAEVQPFFLEYTIQSIQDFSIKNIIEKVVVLNPYKRALDIIKNLESSKISLLEAYDQLSKLQITDKIKMKMLQELGNGPVRNTSISNPLHIDSILSMLDLGDENSVAKPQSTISDNFISEISTDNNSVIHFEKLNEILSNQIEKIAQAIQNTPHFKETAKIWYSLKNLLKLAGRDRILQLFIASCPSEGSDEKLQLFLNQSGDNFCTPDMILWSYQYQSTTSSLMSLENICTIADNYKTLLITSVDRNDPLTKDISSSIPVRTIMEQEGMIPFRRLRANVSSRSCVLCVSSQCETIAVNEFSDAEASWISTAHWIGTLSIDKPLFQWPQRIESISGFSVTPEIKKSHYMEIASSGLTLTQNPAMGYSFAPVVVLDIDEDSPYRSAGFNLIVNRVARLTAEWISSNSNAESMSQITDKLHNFLTSQLKPFQILSSESSLKVTVEQQIATVSLDSNTDIDGYPVRFQFSVEL